ncbi:hypothetical protein E2C01_024806 [Portunus trituberculatus]|uniref:Uncharacterized protein n=1 Tax=Portunus trituberculatus TaxID=210409 RepID=A0A5B7EG57_PORTR|nr:hypothetical protein [Portunus trituberculatus]
MWKIGFMRLAYVMDPKSVKCGNCNDTSQSLGSAKVELYTQLSAGLEISTSKVKMKVLPLSARLKCCPACTTIMHHQDGIRYAQARYSLFAWFVATIKFGTSLVVIQR